MSTIESALLIPVLILMLAGLYDLGRGHLVNQKVTAATYVVSDLVTRKSVVNDDDLDNAVGGAQLVIDPYDRSRLGVDIVGIEFDENNLPFELWRHTDNMAPDASLPDAAEGLGEEGEGLVAVTVTYAYRPFFNRVFKTDIMMEERSFMRGRRTSVVRYDATPGGT